MAPGGRGGNTSLTHPLTHPPTPLARPHPHPQRLACARWSRLAAASGSRSTRLRRTPASSSTRQYWLRTACGTGEGAGGRAAGEARAEGSAHSRAAAPRSPPTLPRRPSLRPRVPRPPHPQPAAPDHLAGERLVLEDQARAGHRQQDARPHAQHLRLVGSAGGHAWQAAGWVWSRASSSGSAPSKAVLVATRPTQATQATQPRHLGRLLGQCVEGAKSDEAVCQGRQGGRRRRVGRGRVAQEAAGKAHQLLCTAGWAGGWVGGRCRHSRLWAGGCEGGQRAARAARCPPRRPLLRTHP